MTKEEIKALALDKVYSIYTIKAFKTADKDPYWSVDKESQKRCIESDRRDLEAWSYILSLIEKDNKL
jgi:hypothetical protein